MMFKKSIMGALFAVLMSGAVSAIDIADLPDPLDSIDVGHWVVYEVMGMQQKQTVAKIDGAGDDRVITLNIEIYDESGKIVAEQEQTLEVTKLRAMQEQMPKDDPDTTITQGTEAIGGKDIPVYIVEVNKNGQTTRLVLSEAIPISCIVRMETVGFGAMMEAIDFGTN